MTYTTYFVTRHAGAIQWAEQQNLKNVVQVKHFDASIIKPGDQVVGTLPINLIAEINRYGGHYGHITLKLTESERGKELTASDMERLGAKIEWFSAVAIDAPAEDSQQLYLGKISDCDEKSANRKSYDVLIERNTANQLFVSISNQNNEDAALEMAIEVHENVPAVHIAGELYSDPLLHIHAGVDGLYVTPHDADEFKPAESNNLTYHQDYSFYVAINRQTI